MQFFHFSDSIDTFCLAMYLWLVAFSIWAMYIIISCLIAHLSNSKPFQQCDIVNFFWHPLPERLTGWCYHELVPQCSLVYHPGALWPLMSNPVLFDGWNCLVLTNSRSCRLVSSKQKVLEDVRCGCAAAANCRKPNCIVRWLALLRCLAGRAPCAPG